MTASIQTLSNLMQLYGNLGVTQVFTKVLAANDNSKNQVYFGPGFKALTILPAGPVQADLNEKKSIFKASLHFQWLADDCGAVAAPGAQLILYPQYPEIRFSGFLKGCQRDKLDTVRELMNSRMAGRVLFLGVHPDGMITGAVFPPTHPVAAEYAAKAVSFDAATDIFKELKPATFLQPTVDSKSLLLAELCRIHRSGWLDSKRLNAAGGCIPCHAPQCGGYTLEAELGIIPNGRSEPDYLGWEVKQHSGTVLTLMTPEPAGGHYAEQGVESFIRHYGYADKLGRADRMNFGGTHFFGKHHHLTGLTLTLTGYDEKSEKISDPNGGIQLLGNTGDVAASWNFSTMLDHWKRKHRNAVYIPCEHRDIPANQYSYANLVRLCEGTDPLMLVKAIRAQKVYYDPGIKLENASSANPKTKRRSQFRVKLKDINSLYETVSIVDVTQFG